MATQNVLERQFPGKRLQLKRDILQAALSCFNEQGLESTTIEQIRHRCDASVGNIYHHFGNKEGLIAALFFCALDDQADLRQQYLDKAMTVADGVSALVYSYLDWVTAEPEWARYQFQARSAVATGPKSEQLVQRNRLRNRQLRERLLEATGSSVLLRVPPDLLVALIIGQSENYARAWLSGRVSGAPNYYREQLARAAWASLEAC